LTDERHLTGQTLFLAGAPIPLCTRFMPARQPPAGSSSRRGRRGKLRGDRTGKRGGSIAGDVEDGGRNVRCFRSSILSSSGVIRRRRFRRRVAVRACKEDRFVRTATNEWRGSLLRGREMGQLSACDLLESREKKLKNNNNNKKRKKEKYRSDENGTSVCLREKDFVRRRIDALRQTAWRLANVRKKETSSRLRNYKDGSD